MVGVQPSVEGPAARLRPQVAAEEPRASKTEKCPYWLGAPKATDWASFLFYLKTMGSTKSHLRGK